VIAVVDGSAAAIDGFAAGEKLAAREGGSLTDCW
jgi:hypothetical protein